MIEENFIFTSKAKSKLFILIAVGLVLSAFGVFGVSQDWWDPAHSDEHHSSLLESNLTVEHHESHGDSHVAHDTHNTHENHETVHEEHGHGGGHGYSYIKRVWMALWINNIYFLGISIVGLFFFALNYVTWAGWSAAISRVFLSFGSYLPIGGLITVVLFMFGYHDIFHWADADVVAGDKILQSKEWYLNLPFYIGRMIAILVGWAGFHFILKREAGKEDLNGGVDHHGKIINWSGGFIVFFGVSSSIASWDWIMSIDPHWFSTLFGWFVFSSWLVAGISAMTLLTIYLKEAGYLKIVSKEHLHDLGKFMFAFSIFWTYIWFSQFILYYYSNIPEETIYFVERLFLNMGNYGPIFIINLFINFLFPFLFLMTRASKRVNIMLKVAAIAILLGHWFDFYLMMAPGVLKEHGGLNLGMIFLEGGVALVFIGTFIFCLLVGLSSVGLIPKNHPFIQESIHHHT